MISTLIQLLTVLNANHFAAVVLIAIVAVYKQQPPRD